MDIGEEFDRIVGALEAACLEYAVCGALAVAVHGAPRATKDIDLLVDPADLQRVLSTVRLLGYSHLASLMTFPDGMRLQRVTRIHDGQFLILDLILVNEHTAAAWASRQVFHTERGPVKVVGREALIQMKAWAGRPQDAHDIERLSGDDR